MQRRLLFGVEIIEVKTIQNAAERLDLNVARDWFGRNLGFEGENIPKAC